MDFKTAIRTRWLGYECQLNTEHNTEYKGSIEDRKKILKNKMNYKERRMKNRENKTQI